MLLFRAQFYSFVYLLLFTAHLFGHDCYPQHIWPEKICALPKIFFVLLYFLLAFSCFFLFSSPVVIRSTFSYSLYCYLQHISAFSSFAFRPFPEGNPGKICCYFRHNKFLFFIVIYSTIDFSILLLLLFSLVVILCTFPFSGHVVIFSISPIPFSFLNDRINVSFSKVVIHSTFLCFFSAAALLYKTHFRQRLGRCYYSHIGIFRTVALLFAAQCHCKSRHIAVVIYCTSYFINLK